MSASSPLPRLLPLPLLLLLLHCFLCLVPVRAQSGDSQVLGIVPKYPVYSLNFSAAPNALIGTAPAWTWSLTDPMDSTTVATKHQGVCILTGVSTSWVDLTTATGAQSAGYAIPQWGGPGNSYGGTQTAGWSIEIVMKYNVLPAAGTWAKTFELADGPASAVSTNTNNNLALSWDNGGDAGDDSGFKLDIEQYTAAAAQPLAYHGIIEALVPQANTWYHMVVTMAPVGTAGAANWYVYVNGASLNYANALSPNATLAAIQGANMPLNVPRPISTLGKSAWSDPYAAVTIDAFRVYDYVLQPATVGALATAYGLNQPMPVQTSYPFPSSAESTATNGLVSTPPIFNAPFATNPTSAVGSSLAYTYLSVDLSDSAAAQRVHTGLIALNGSAGSYVSLASSTGANSAGVVLPILGLPGSGSGSTQGLSFEVVFKATVLPTSSFRSKVFDFGQGASTDNFGMGFENNANGWCLEMQNNWPIAYTYARWDIGSAWVPQPNTWYHMVWVMSQPNLTNYTSTWTFYINGQQVTGTYAQLVGTTGGLYPLPISRPFAWLGGSDWADANSALTFDAMRVYDYALSAAQVTSLANIYSLASNNSQSGDSQVLGIVPKYPVYSLNFSAAPNALIGTAPAWTWSLTDPMDSTTVATKHQGVCILTGVSTSWVDLTTATGAQSAGYAIPQWGGPGNSYGGTQTAGWSIEIVMKYNVLPAAGTWAKTFELADGPASAVSTNTNNNLALSWDNGGDAGDDSGFKLDIEQYTAAAAQPLAYHGIIEALVPQANTWYHMVVTMAPVGTAGAANWYVYVNGASLNYANALSPNATLAAIQGANMPLNVPRPISTLGKSAWSDPYAAVTIDAFRVYDYVLQPATVGALATAYGLNQPMPVQTSYPFPSSAESTATNGLVSTPPIFNAPFATNPTSAVGSSLAYTYLSVDLSDSAAAQRVHTGLIALNGSAGSYVSLASSTGANSAGVVLPILGLPGSGSGSTQGLSFEVVFKATVLPTSSFRSKVFDFGQGASTDNFGMGFENNANGWCLEMQNNWPIAYTYARWDIGSAWVPQPNTWYHMVWVMSQPNLTNYTSTWTFYINGQQVTGTYAQLVGTTGGLYPLPISRPFAWLGGSDWADANSALTFDAMRVYDYALSAAQVTSLANLYALPAMSSTGMAAVSCTSAGSGGDGAIWSIVPKYPVYNLNFTQNPACLTGVNSAWTWQTSDSLDTGNTATMHQGVAVLTGVSTSWVDLTTATGAQSAGYAIPQWGGPGNSYGGTQTAGWSIEIVMKYNVLPAAGTWAKTFELADGPASAVSTNTNNNLALSWDNGGDAGDDSGFKLDIEQYTAAAAQPLAYHGIIEALVPQANTWYHMVVTMAPVGTAGAANWYVYVNGASLNYANALSPNATLAAIQGANMPLNVPRPISTLGKSAWSDPYAAVTIDAFRVYDYVLQPATVGALATAYGLNQPMPVQTSYPFPSSAESTATNGLVSTPPIFNAPFATNPTSAVGSSLAYTYLSVDLSDSAAAQRVHTGLIALNGSAGSYVSLASSTGANSAGVVLPILGLPGSGSGSTQGLSFEVVFKATVLPTSSFRSKVFDFGQGASTDNFGMGFENNANGWCLEMQNNWPIAYTYARWDIGSAWVPQPNTWYHMVWVMSQPNLTNYTSTWTFYINGQQVTGTYAQLVGTTGGLYPLPISRPFAWLGGSDWADANSALTFDAMRVYDYALSAAQVTSLANIYSLASNNSQSGDSQVLGIVPKYPVYSLNFSAAPNALIGTAPAWTWSLTDPMDSTTVATKHQGVCILTGVSTSWVDLTTATGAQSAGYAIPQWGGPGNSYGGTQTAGWSIEIVMKYNVLPAAGTWAKTFELADGPASAVSTNTNNNLALSWDNGGDAGDDSGFKLDIEQYTAAAAQPLAYHGIIEALVPQANTWYHMVVTMAPVGTAGAANWYVYVNGASLNYANALSPNATLAAIQGANMPLNVPRPISTLGKSAWSDPYAAVTIDAFRVYDYVLQPATVGALATAYGLNQPMPVQTSYPFPSSAESTATNGLVSTPPIFNAPFATNPTSAVGSSLAYTYLSVDLSDSAAAQRVHTGLIALNGSAGSYVSLASSTGANSAGVVLPILGLPGSGSGSTQGLSFEVVFKATVLPTSSFRSKVFDFGQGASTDNFGMGFENNANGWCLEMQNNWPIAYTYARWDIGSAWVPQPNTWYHMVWVMSQPNLTNYTSTWTFYINGQQVTGTYAQLVGTTGGLYPLPISRPFAWLGGSDWADANSALTFDAMRVYGYALTAGQVGSLAALYSLSSSSAGSNPQPVASSAAAAPATSAPSPPTTSTAAVAPSGGGGGGGSSLSSGAIAGIVIGSVVGAALLLCVLVFFFCWPGRSQKAKQLHGEESQHTGDGRYDQVDRSTTGAAGESGETGDVEMA